MTHCHNIPTHYRLNGPRIEFRRRQCFPDPPRPALGPIQPPVQWVPGLLLGVGVKPTDLYSVEVKERLELCFYSPFWTFTASSRVKFTTTRIFTHYSTVPFIAPFISPISNYESIFCVSVCSMLHYMTDAQLFLQPQPAPHSILSHLYT